MASAWKSGSQELPPKGGFFIPKFRISTITQKGFTTPQMIFLYGLFIAGGWSILGHYSELRNGQNYINVSSTSMQKHVLDMMHGPATFVQKSIHPYRPPVSFFGEVDARTRTFVSGVALLEQKMAVDEYRKKQAAQTPQ